MIYLFHRQVKAGETINLPSRSTPQRSEHLLCASHQVNNDSPVPALRWFSLGAGPAGSPGSPGLGRQKPGHCVYTEEPDAAWGCQGWLLRRIGHVVKTRRWCVPQHAPDPSPAPCTAPDHLLRCSQPLLLLTHPPSDHLTTSHICSLGGPRSCRAARPGLSWNPLCPIYPHCPEALGALSPLQWLVTRGALGTYMGCPRPTIETKKIFLLLHLHPGGSGFSSPTGLAFPSCFTPGLPSWDPLPQPLLPPSSLNPPSCSGNLFSKLQAGYFPPT